MILLLLVLCAESMARLRVTDGPDKGSNTAQNVYPDRPGEPDCSYYMRTGTCAYGSNCRYNHPTYIGQVRIKISH